MKKVSFLSTENMILFIKYNLYNYITLFLSNISYTYMA